ncbi:histone H3 methyltransferase SUV39H1/Clr4 [Penicillium chermesinum]|nr:histone H3 methyltransferase SUV39H1/Clr4 [Penicillium chermesinum]
MHQDHVHAQPGNLDPTRKRLLSPFTSLKRKSIEIESDENEKDSLSDTTAVSSENKKFPKSNLKNFPAPSSPPATSTTFHSKAVKHHVNVVIPSPTARQQKDLSSLKTEAPFQGLSTVLYPVDEEEKGKLPCAVTTTLDLTESPHVPPTQLVLQSFRRKIQMLDGPGVTFAVDDEKLAYLSTTFEFINDYMLGESVTPVDEAFNSGCSCVGPCDPATCGCLVDDYGDITEDNGDANSEDEQEPIGKINPYDRKRSTAEKMVLSPEFLKKRQRIYECNFRCSCKGNCWNKIVQHGRQIRLEIFDTGNRGFGLRSLDPVVTGQFIDRYLGEVITEADADLREAADSKNKSYLFSLDFNQANFEEGDKLYIVDGQKFGSPTRFMNHSCNPNCKIIPVSTTNPADDHLYHLAFFALREIPAGTELTFDYNPTGAAEKVASDDPTIVPCLCGEKVCRGQLWPNARQKGQLRRDSA